VGQLGWAENRPAGTESEPMINIQNYCLQLLKSPSVNALPSGRHTYLPQLQGLPFLFS